MNVLIIDNFDSFVYNLVQYIGELGAKPIVVRVDEFNINKIKRLSPRRIIISPGPGNPKSRVYIKVFSEILTKLSVKIPTLGVCLGHQAIASVFGGEIIHAKNLLHGKVSQVAHDSNSIFRYVKNPIYATRYHSLTVKSDGLPSVLKITASSLEDGEIMGLRHVNYPIEGVQFHPESILTEDGMKILRNFIDRGVTCD
ncbi:MAG: anthranilate synthase component II [Candidatus Odinarchaeia archaeon]